MLFPNLSSRMGPADNGNQAMRFSQPDLMQVNTILIEEHKLSTVNEIGVPSIRPSEIEREENKLEKMYAEKFADPKGYLD